MLWSIQTGIWGKRLPWTQPPFSIRYVAVVLMLLKKVLYHGFMVPSIIPCNINLFNISFELQATSFFFGRLSQLFPSLTGSRSHWSPLSIWGRIWWYRYCNSPAVNHTFNDWNTGSTSIIDLKYAYHVFYGSCAYFAVADVECFNAKLQIFIQSSFSVFSLFPGFVCPGTVGLAWYAVANPLHIVMARQSILFRDNLASPWSLQVSLFAFHLVFLKSIDS